MKRIFITGKPGVGKTTLLMFIVNELIKKGYKVVGFYCPEVREEGRRIGFKIVGIPSGEERWLARIGEGRIKVGKYAIQEEAEEIVNKVKNSISNAQIIAIDEIGPMELSIPPIRDFINEVLKIDKPLIAVVHRSVKLNGEIYVVNEENRETLRKEILEKLLNL